MKCWNKDNKMWRRRLLAAVFILLFLCIQEAAANYHALTGEYELLELDGRMQKTVEDGKEKYYLYYQAEPGLYAGQLKIRGDFREKIHLYSGCDGGEFLWKDGGDQLYGYGGSQASGGLYRHRKRGYVYKDHDAKGCREGVSVRFFDQSAGDQ